MNTLQTYCRHWHDCGIAGGGCCRLGLYGGRPSHGVCRACPTYTGPNRGLGDWVHRFAKPAAWLLNRIARRNVLGNSRCGCHARRIKLNKLKLR